MLVLSVQISHIALQWQCNGGDLKVMVCLLVYLFWPYELEQINREKIVIGDRDSTYWVTEEVQCVTLVFVARILGTAPAPYLS